MRTDILTQSGFYFDVINPNPLLVDVDDIAHGLSNTCRFAGQCDHFYSVAEHSVLLSQQMPNKELALLALFHDATEAYIGDVSSPLKQCLINYKNIERRLHHAIYEHLGLNPQLPPEIKEGDLRMLLTEKNQIMPSHDDQWESEIEGYTPYDNVRIECWEPLDAKEAFLKQVHYLSGP